MKLTITLAIAFVLTTGGCIFGVGDCKFEPIGASIRAPVLSPIQSDQVGACGHWVDIDGYYWTQNIHSFELDAETLEPIGEATAAARGVTALAAPTIYAIPGVDSDEAVAMERPDGSFVVFTYDGSGAFPASLCPMLAPTGNPDTGGCPQVLPTP